jgi:superfamily II DNA helicase RecQ
MENGEYRLIFTSPEMLEQNKKLGELLDSKKFRKLLLAVNFDEAHCVYQWGTEFRKAYDRLSHLRARLPPQVALFACSATLTPDMFNNVLDRLGFRPERIAIRLSNNRTNIYLNMREMEHAVGSYKDLRFLVPSSAKSTSDIVRTIIYFDK